MNVSSHPAYLLDLQVPQTLALVYLLSAGAVLPAVLYARRVVRERRGVGAAAGVAGMVLAVVGVTLVVMILVAIVAVTVPGVVMKAVFVGCALLLIGGTVIFVWPLRRHVLEWLRANPATRSFDDAHMNVLADRHAIYVSAIVGLLTLYFATGLVLVGLSVVGLVRNPSEATGARSGWFYAALVGSAIVTLCGIAILQRVFPDAALIEVYRHGRNTTRLVVLCSRCFNRDVNRAPEVLRDECQQDADKKLEAMAKSLRHSEADTPAVRSAIHEALTPSLSLRVQDVVDWLRSEVPSQRTGLTRFASFVAVLSGAVASIQILIDVVAPIFA